MPTPTFRPQDVTVVFAGIPISGFAKGTFVSWARNSDSFTPSVGSAGEGGRAASGDKSGSVTLTTMQTSPVNGVLSALAKADEETGDGVGLLAIKDLSGLSIITGPEAWLRKPADGELSNELTNREWIFDMIELEIFDGGNPI